ncbi:MAG: CoA transferase [Nitratireductor sp.]
MLLAARGEPPVPPLNLAADYAGGTMFLLLGVLAALYEAQRSGKGQVVDAAMVDGVPALMGLFTTSLRAGNGSRAREQPARWRCTFLSLLRDFGWKISVRRALGAAVLPNLSSWPISPRLSLKLV